MTERGLFLLLAFLGGGALGFFYFGTLWLTVRRIAGSRYPGFLSIGSFFARLGVTIYGFHVVMGDHWERLFVSLIGFFVVRRLLISRMQPASPAGS